MKYVTGILIIVSCIAAFAGCGGYAGLGGRDITGGSGPEVTENGIRFTLYSENAESVAIAGDFNNWSKTADQLSFDERDGEWEIVIPLPEGRYEYKFVIDGEEWIADPGNSARTEDGFGGYNSVIRVE
jgi:1,4-alpha-glucan branching enzyme